MNQDQVKEQLLRIEPNVEPFTLLFSGKKSKRVHGLYKPETKEIIIHNKNFTKDNGIIYTAIHEFAHHIHFTRYSVPVGSRAHTKQFGAIFHGLLNKAEEIGVYQNFYQQHVDFIELTRTIKNEYLVKNGELMKEFGRLLYTAMELCMEHEVSFEDYVDRELSLHHSTAKSIVKVFSMDVDPRIGFENMKTVAGIKSDEKREEAQQAFLDGGVSPDMVREEFAKPPEPEETIVRLERERQRIERSIERLKEQLLDVEKRIIDMAD
jgi:hypothetical protein